MRNRCIGIETEEGRRRRREKWEKIPSKQNYRMKNGTKQISWGFYLCKFSRTKCWKNSWAIKEAGMDREKLTSIRARQGRERKSGKNNSKDQLYRIVSTETKRQGTEPAQWMEWNFREQWRAFTDFETFTFGRMQSLYEGLCEESGHW